MTIFACWMCFLSLLKYRIPALTSWSLIFLVWFLVLSTLRSNGRARVRWVPALPIALALLLLLLVCLVLAPPLVLIPGISVMGCCFGATASAVFSRESAPGRWTVCGLGMLAVVCLVAFGAWDCHRHCRLTISQRLALLSPLYRVAELNRLLGPATARWRASTDTTEEANGLNPTGLYGEALLDFAQKYPSLAFGTLCYLIEIGRGSPPKIHQAALAQILLEEKDNPNISWLCQQLGDYSVHTTAEVAFMRDLLGESENPTVKAAAAYNLARMLGQLAVQPADPDPLVAPRRGEMARIGVQRERPTRDARRATMDEARRLATMVTEEFPNTRPPTVQRTYGLIDYRFAQNLAEPTYGQRAQELLASLTSP